MSCAPRFTDDLWQVDFLRQQFLQEGQGRPPFTEILSVECFTQVLEKINLCWNDSIYTPIVTLWVFLGQVLSADHSCRAAVARLIAHRVSQGLEACSSKTGAYCGARKRLAEDSSPSSPAWWDRSWRHRPRLSGSGRAVAFSCLMDRRFPCPIRRKTERPILCLIIKRLARVSRLLGLERSSPSRVERSSTWAFAVMRERAGRSEFTPSAVGHSTAR